MLYILNTTASVFITILIGFMCGALRLFKPGQDKILINYVFYIALPANLFLSCYNAKWSIFNLAYLSSYLVSAIIIIALSYLLNRYWFKFTLTNSIINSLNVSPVGVGLFTMPLFMVVFGETHLAMPLMVWQSVVFMTLGIFCLQLSVEKRQGNYIAGIFGKIIRAITSNPVIILSLIGLTAGTFALKLPSFLITSTKSIGDTLSTVALFSLGLTCAFNFRSLRSLSQLIPLITMVTLKLLLFPLIALLIGSYFGLDAEYLLALVLFSASPAAAHTYIIAKRYNMDADLATFSVIFSTMLSFISINLWLYMLSKILSLVN
jgi:hypothetical protein